LVILLSARCDGCDIGKIASHPGPNPGFRIVASQNGDAGCDLARAVPANDCFKTPYTGCPADRARRNHFRNTERNGEVAKASGHLVV
jgi:hypothetical protein